MNREHFLYYKKQYPIPLIGDVVIIYYSNDKVNILVEEVHIDKKNNTYFKGPVLEGTDGDYEVKKPSTNRSFYPKKLNYVKYEIVSDIKPVAREEVEKTSTIIYMANFIAPEFPEYNTTIGVFSSRKKARAYIKENYLYWNTKYLLLKEPISKDKENYFTITKKTIDEEEPKELNIIDLLDKIKSLFDLNVKEMEIFSSYVKYMIKESQIPFLKKIFISSREYLESFINSQLEDLGKEMFSEESEEASQSVPILTKDDLNSTIRLELYIRLMEQLRGKEKSIKRWYKKLDFDPKNYDTETEKRKGLYKKFKEWLDTLTQGELQEFFLKVR